MRTQTSQWCSRLFSACFFQCINLLHRIIVENSMIQNVSSNMRGRHRDQQYSECTKKRRFTIHGLDETMITIISDIICKDSDIIFWLVSCFNTGLNKLGQIVRTVIMGFNKKKLYIWKRRRHNAFSGFHLRNYFYSLSKIYISPWIVY